MGLITDEDIFMSLESLFIAELTNVLKAGYSQTLSLMVVRWCFENSFIIFVRSYPLHFLPQEIIGGNIGGIIGCKRAPGHGFPSFNLFWFFLAFSFSLSVHAGIPVRISVVHFGADILPKPPNPPKP